MEKKRQSNAYGSALKQVNKHAVWISLGSRKQASVANTDDATSEALGFESRNLVSAEDGKGERKNLYNKLN